MMAMSAFKSFSKSKEDYCMRWIHFSPYSIVAKGNLKGSV